MENISKLLKSLIDIQNKYKVEQEDSIALEESLTAVVNDYNKLLESNLTLSQSMNSNYNQGILDKSESEEYYYTFSHRIRTGCENYMMKIMTGGLGVSEEEVNLFEICRDILISHAGSELKNITISDLPDRDIKSLNEQ